MSPREHAPVTPQRAVSRGYLVPSGDFAGTVHSVFSSAFNIAVDGTLVTVHDSRLPHTPTSIRVLSASSAPWSGRVAVGLAARVRNGCLRVGSTSLDVSGLPVWTPRGPCPRTSLESSTLRELEQIYQNREPADVQWPGELHSAVERLRVALNSQKRDSAELTDAVSALIGFGPGLTPSGDDVLVGVLAALVRGGAQPSQPYRAARTIADAIEAGKFRTNDISRHYLQLAADGNFGEALTNLIDAVADNTTGLELRARAQTVLSVGASSGSDALGGALIGLASQVEGHNHVYPTAFSRRSA